MPRLMEIVRLDTVRTAAGAEAVVAVADAPLAHAGFDFGELDNVVLLGAVVGVDEALNV